MNSRRTRYFQKIRCISYSTGPAPTNLYDYIGFSVRLWLTYGSFR